MAFPYTNVTDARQHLHQTYILFDGKPAFVADITEAPSGLMAVLDINGQSEPTHTSLWDTRIQTRGFKLGYVNLSSGVTYLQRIPRRQYQQGLSNQNVLSSNGDNFLRYIARSKAFYQAMTGVYPTIAECIELLKSRDSAAFHVDFCLSRLNSGLTELMYQNTSIGVLINNKFVVGPSFSKWITKYLPKEYVDEQSS